MFLVRRELTRQEHLLKLPRIQHDLECKAKRQRVMRKKADDAFPKEKMMLNLKGKYHGVFDIFC